MPISAVSEIGVTRTRSLPERLDERLVLGVADVLSEVQDRVVALHLLMDRLADRGDVGQLACHWSSPPQA